MPRWLCGRPPWLVAERAPPPWRQRATPGSTMRCRTRRRIQCATGGRLSHSERPAAPLSRHCRRHGCGQGRLADAACTASPLHARHLARAGGDGRALARRLGLRRRRRARRGLRRGGALCGSIELSQAAQKLARPACCWRVMPPPARRHCAPSATPSRAPGSCCGPSPAEINLPAECKLHGAVGAEFCRVGGEHHA